MALFGMFRWRAQTHGWRRRELQGRENTYGQKFGSPRGTSLRNGFGESGFEATLAGTRRVASWPSRQVPCREQNRRPCDRGNRKGWRCVAKPRAILKPRILVLRSVVHHRPRGRLNRPGRTCECIRQRRQPADCSKHCPLGAVCLFTFPPQASTVTTIASSLFKRPFFTSR